MKDKRIKDDLGTVYRHLIMLCKSKEEAQNIQKDAFENGIEVGEVWIDRFDSLWMIKNDQLLWRKNNLERILKDFPKMYDEFCYMKTNYFKGITIEELKRFLLDKHSCNDKQISNTVKYERSVYIKEYAKKIANGFCQLCENEAPFKDKQGNGFLEVHHIQYLSQGGSDTIDNVVALCPNCHRKMHHLELDVDIKKIKEKALEKASY